MKHDLYLFFTFQFDFIQNKMKIEYTSNISTCLYYFILSTIYRTYNEHSNNTLCVHFLYKASSHHFVKERGWYVIIIISNQKALYEYFD